ncbi:MAG: xanthine dehydrogenase family protein molybdopterin-binding subunit [Burkholderiales bacterium]|nr:xanthine dehydrogenase family protein molybdopterin-binding subunit [Burkholderiales bacterium]
MPVPDVAGSVAPGTAAAAVAGGASPSSRAARGLLGAAVARKDGPAKILGEARYVDDLVLPGMLHGATVRTRAAGGILERIEFGSGIDWDSFVVVTAADVPGINATQMIEQDQPVLAEHRFRHAGEPVLLLAHADRGLLREAVEAVTLHERADPSPVFSIDDALALRGEVVPGNVYRDYLMSRGDLAAGEAAAEVFFEGRFETGAQEHVYIEPQGMIAYVDAAGVLVVEGSLQCPYYVLGTLTAVTGRDAGSVRVVHCTTGGGFGGKEDYPSQLAAHAALLTLKAGGRPVKLVYDRAEDMLATPKRHPSRTLVRIGAGRDGRLCFLDVDFVLDGGAYTTLSPVVLSRGVIHAPGAYACANARVRGRAVATSHPPNGAFRGFGAPQSIFAIEQAMDGLAEALGMSPLELRRMNMLRPGDRSVPGQTIDATTDFDAVLDQALHESGYLEKRDAFAEFNAANAAAGRPLRRGIGLATFHHGAGFTGNGEVVLASEARVRANVDGCVEVVASSSEMGQGSTTTLCQIVASALGLPLERVSQAPVDTHDVPDSGPTVASRTCMVVGLIVEQAARLLRAELIQKAGLPASGADEHAFAAACARYLDGHPRLEAQARYEPPANVQWDETVFEGSPYASYAWAAYVAEVEIDLATCEVALSGFTAVQEVGKVVNPVIAAGQVEGGVVQGIGFALFEKVAWGNTGTMANNRLTNYIIPTTADIPPVQVFFQEQPGGIGPAGAKGLGELPMDGPGPAILSAVNFALGTRISSLPVMPEDVMAALSAHALRVAA